MAAEAETVRKQLWASQACNETQAHSQVSFREIWGYSEEWLEKRWWDLMEMLVQEKWSRAQGGIL